MALVSGLHSALAGMQTAQAQISLVSNNIANVDTEGYTRKTAQQQSMVIAGNGVGVKLGNAERVVDQSLLRSYLSSNSLSANLSKSYDYLSKTENLIGNPQSNNSLSADVANLQSLFETLATDVTSSANRYSLVSEAVNLTSRLNNLSTEIQSLRGDADMEIESVCEKVNTTLDEIANLNNQIVKYKALGYNGLADLEDKRDVALKNLSGYIDISYYTRDSGEVVIQTKGGVSLIDKNVHKLSHGAISQATSSMSYANGNINGIYVDGKDITTSIKSGELKGLIDVRDTILPSLQMQLDELAGVMKDTVNNIHNQGTSYPGALTQIEGSRSFIDPDNQIVNIAQGDVRFTIFDAQGNQISTTTLVGELGFNNKNDKSVSSLINTMDTWLKKSLPQASASIDNNGRVVIDTGDSNYYLSIMDTETATMGSPQSDATVTIDNNKDGKADRSFSGFSSFLGLNDFFVSNNDEYVYQSNVLSKTADLGVRNSVSLDIRTKEINAEITINPGDSLEEIVEKINSNEILDPEIKAALIPNGTGYVLQINNSGGEQMEISENTATGFLSRLGIRPSYSSMASKIQVREDIQVNPNILSVGTPEFNTNTGKYHLNDGNNNIANKLAQAFAKEHSFNQTGTLTKMATTLADYASTFVGSIASQTSSSLNGYEYQAELVNSISNKQAEISGVDSDQELANLIIYQQSYSACAQVWSATRELVDILFNAL